MLPPRLGAQRASSPPLHSTGAGTIACGKGDALVKRAMLPFRNKRPELELLKLSNDSSLPVGCSNSSDTARALRVLLLTCHQSLRLLHWDPLTHQPLGSQEDLGLSCLHISECAPNPLPLGTFLFTFKGPAAMLSSVVGCTKSPLLPSPRYIHFLIPEPVMLPNMTEDMTELGS